MSQIGLRYFGISAFEITTEKGIKVLIDPCITGFRGHKYSPVGLEAFPKIDLILVSHGAADHLGDTLQLAQQTGCDVMCAVDVATFLSKKGLDTKKILRTLWGKEYDYKGLRIRTVESHHVSWLEYDNQVLSAIPLGFIVYTESGLGIFHPGDTSIFSDLKLFAELYSPQVGLLPIGLLSERGGKHELSSKEAAIVARWMGLRMVIPMHYDKTVTDPQEFVQHVNHETPNTKVIVLEPGEETIYSF